MSSVAATGEGHAVEDDGEHYGELACSVLEALRAGPPVLPLMGVQDALTRWRLLEDQRVAAWDAYTAAVLAARVDALFRLGDRLDSASARATWGRRAVVQAYEAEGRIAAAYLSWSLVKDGGRGVRLTAEDLGAIVDQLNHYGEAGRHTATKIVRTLLETGDGALTADEIDAVVNQLDPIAGR